MHPNVQGLKETDARIPEKSAGRARSKIAITGNDVHFFSARPLRFWRNLDDREFGGRDGRVAIWIIGQPGVISVLADRAPAKRETYTSAGISKRLLYSRARSEFASTS